uniref:YhbY family RNA-binding protein n=1 Tax=Fervidicoccus fontis TaxID=683846 RepID=A0A7J3ZJ72_9CREN
MRTPKAKRRLVVEKIHGSADVNIGKKGVTPELIREISERMKAERVLKVRINKNLLRTGIERREIAREVAERVGAELVEVRGYTFIIARTSRKRQER